MSAALYGKVAPSADENPESRRDLNSADWLESTCVSHLLLLVVPEGQVVVGIIVQSRGAEAMT